MNNLDEINNSQLIAICRGAAQRCDEQHGYMELASSDPHGWLPNQWVIDAMRDLLRINSEEVAELRAENKALTSYKAENESLRNAVNIDIEAAAKMLAACMDYPWEHMPANGRDLMRRHAKDIVDAAISSPENH